MERITTIIVDDEERSRSSLRNLLGKYCKDVEVLEEAATIEEAVSLIEARRPELLMLDIRLKEGTSFEILRRLSHSDFYVIFTTAYDEYAIKAFKFSAIDYLLKPIDLEELIAAISKVKKIIRQNPKTSTELINQLLTFNLNDPNITVPTTNTLEFVRIRQILWLKSEGAYTEIHLRDKKMILSSKNLGYFENILRDSGFFRTHHSHMVNLNAVKRYVKKDGGYIELQDKTTIPISRRRKEQFMQFYSNSR
ncbi:MAG: LytTR family DNA-binding domain-containing protein [Eudoraea sp.]|nr:LytTR family DNA-binding domain-containing protein [Eudoraea sp.]